jgi:hypothetical protein
MFAGLVVQNTNMALVLMGKVPHPETGERTQDLDAAQFFIDQLEMLAVKTKGNLDKREEQLLQQNITALRMAFVEAVEDAKGSPPSQARGETNAASATAPNTSAHPNVASAAPETEEESRKKFSKKY